MKTCEVCGISIIKPRTESARNYELRKYCGKKCAGIGESRLMAKRESEFNHAAGSLIGAMKNWRMA